MSILKYKDPKTGEFKRINPYKADLSFVGKDGIVVNKDPNSEMVEISGSGCVQVTTTPYIVYGTTSGGAQLNRPFADNPTVNAIAQYSNTGLLRTNAPVEDNDCTNKKYVADNYVEKVKFTNLEQALNGYILDTTKETYADLDSAVLKNSVAVGNNVYPIADKTRALVTRIEGKTAKMVQLFDKSVIPATKTVNGITYTNNNDGSITINGTATAESYIIIVARDKVTNGNKILYGSEQNASDYGVAWGTNLYSSKFITATTNNNYTVIVKSGVTVDNVKIYPQLFDLTAMNREDITTAEQFKAEFPDLYPYENGNIYPAKISGVKFTGKNLFDLSTPKYSGQSSFVLNGNKIVVSQTMTETYISANFELPNAKFLIGKKLSISAKVKTSGNNYGAIRVLWMREGLAIRNDIDIISAQKTGETEVNLSASGIVQAPSDNALKFCLLLYSNAGANLSEVKTYTATYSDIQVEISDAPTAYEPYIEPVSVTLPETYDLHGVGDNKDYLEITKNENNELYTLKKVQVIDKHVFDGTETWAVYNRVNFENVAFRTTLLADKYTGWYSRGNLMNLLVNIKTLSADKKGYTHGDNSSNIYISSPNIATPAEMKAHVLAMYEAGTPYVFYGAIQTPVETVIATNLTYEQVTAIRHNGGLIEVEDNTNKGYARPTIKNTVVYRLTATNTAEG